MVLTAVTTAEVAGTEAVVLSDVDVVAVLRAEAKKRAEAADIYEQNARPEKAAIERAELEVIARYLPAAMDDGALAAVVTEEVATATAAGVTGPKAMGVVVKAVKARVGDQADGARIAAAVKAALA